MRAAAIALILMLAIGPRPAAADAVDDMIHELRGSANAKARMLAGVRLTRSGDARGIAALVDALLNDRNKNVRGVAATGLGQLVTAASTAADRQLAISSLSRAIEQDPAERVRRRAQKSHDRLVHLPSPSSRKVDDL